jgi:glucose-1-phosphate thymidylyltransferase
MKGVILAGGTGSRLGELTISTNKHLLPVGTQPMIYHPINRLIEAGITQILIVTGTEHMGSMVQSLGSGKRFGCEFTYKVQDAAGGIAQALGLAQNFCGIDKFCVVLGDNIFSGSLIEFVKDYEAQETGALVCLTSVPDPSRFGVATVTADGSIYDMHEKPSVSELTRLSNYGDPYAITGIYFYDSTVFAYIRSLTPSDRNELEITDVNTIYLRSGKLQYRMLDGWWSDAGTHQSLQTAHNLVIADEGIKAGCKECFTTRNVENARSS